MFPSILAKCIGIVLLLLAAEPAFPKSKHIKKNILFTIPTVKIESSTNSLCKGATISFTAAITNGGSVPTYLWKINNKIIAGATLPIFSTADLFTGDQIQCFLMADPTFPGLETYNAASNIITVNVFTEVTPSATISTSQNNICPGTPVTFSIQTKNAGQNPTYDWRVNGKSIGRDQNFIYNNFRDKDQVTCYIVSDNPCNPFPVPSNIITINAKGAPAINIVPGDTLVEAGSQLQLQTFISSPYASFIWEPSEFLIDPSSISPQTKPLLNAVDFKLSIQTTAGCFTTAHTSIKVFRKLYMPNTFSPNSDGINDIFRIPPDVALILNEFAIFDRSGNKIFSTSDVTKGWDGTYKGRNKDSGVYIYFIKGNIEAKNITVKNGFVLIR